MRAQLLTAHAGGELTRDRKCHSVLGSHDLPFAVLLHYPRGGIAMFTVQTLLPQVGRLHYVRVG